MKSGTMVDRRDQVRTTFFSFLSFMPATFFVRWSSVKGPFFNERDMLSQSLLPLALFGLAGNDPLISPLVVPRFESTGRLSPRGYRMASTRGLTFTTTVRVIHRIHGDSAIVRLLAGPAGPARLAQRNVFVIDI